GVPSGSVHSSEGTVRLVPAIDPNLRKVKPVQVRSKINDAKLRGFKVTFGCTSEAIHSVDGLRPTRFCRNDPIDHAPRAEPAAGGPPIPELFWLGVSWIKLTWAGHVVVRFLCDCTLEQNEQLLVFHWSRLWRCAPKDDGAGVRSDPARPRGAGDPAH